MHLLQGLETRNYLNKVCSGFLNSGAQSEMNAEKSPLGIKITKLKRK